MGDRMRKQTEPFEKHIRCEWLDVGHLLLSLLLRASRLAEWYLCVSKLLSENGDFPENGVSEGQLRMHTIPKRFSETRAHETNFMRTR